MTSAAAPVPESRPPFVITGRHVLAGVVAFFAVIIAVDTIMVTQAYRTFSGQVAKNPYEAGLAYNRTLAQRRAEAALGWSMTVDAAPDHRITVALKDRLGRPLEGLRVTGVLERPATEKGRLEIAFSPVAPGVYRSASVRTGGAWDLTATARNGAGDVMDAERRLTWP